MGWTAYYYLQRESAPLADDERLRLAEHLGSWSRHPWECEPYELQLAPGPRADGLLAYGMIKLPMTAEHEDAEALLDALTELRGLLEGTRLWASDDWELLGWDDDANRYVLDGEHVADGCPEFADLDGFVSARADVPPAMSQQLTEVLRRVAERQPVDNQLLTEELAADVMMALVDCDDASRELIDELTLVAEMVPSAALLDAGFANYERVVSSPARDLFHRALAGCGEVHPYYVERFLELWKRTGVSRYWYVDLADLPADFLRQPAIEQAMCSDLVNRIDIKYDVSPDRVEMAARIAGQGTGTDSLAALVDIARSGARRKRRFKPIRDQAAESIARRANRDLIPTLLLEVGYGDPDAPTRAVKAARRALETLQDHIPAELRDGRLNDDQLRALRTQEGEWLDRHIGRLEAYRTRPRDQPDHGSGRDASASTGEPYDFFADDAPSGGFDHGPAELIELSLPAPVANQVIRFPAGFEVAVERDGFGERVILRGGPEPLIDWPLEAQRAVAVVRDHAGRTIGLAYRYVDLAEQVDWQIDLPRGVLALGNSIELGVGVRARLDHEIARLQTGPLAADRRRTLILGEQSLAMPDQFRVGLAATLSSEHQLQVIAEIERLMDGIDADGLDVVISLHDEGGSKLCKDDAFRRLLPGATIRVALDFDLDAEIVARVRGIAVRLTGDLETEVVLGPLRYRD